MSGSAAFRTMSRRAIQCSFSSVFHLRKAGMKDAQAREVEAIFSKAVLGPLVLMGAAGALSFGVQQARKMGLLLGDAQGFAS